MEVFSLGIGIIIGATITYLFMKGVIKEADEAISRLNKRIKQLEDESKTD
jgi:uncharacterized membrane protein YdjX (TVP38/TMEM64 family)